MQNGAGGGRRRPARIRSLGGERNPGEPGTAQFVPVPGVYDDSRISSRAVTRSVRSGHLDRGRSMGGPPSPGPPPPGLDTVSGGPGAAPTCQRRECMYVETTAPAAGLSEGRGEKERPARGDNEWWVQTRGGPMHAAQGQ
jgi:hypothetical protein